MILRLSLRSTRSCRRSNTTFTTIRLTTFVGLIFILQLRCQDFHNFCKKSCKTFTTFTTFDENLAESLLDKKRPVFNPKIRPESEKWQKMAKNGKNPALFWVPAFVLCRLAYSEPQSATLSDVPGYPFVFILGDRKTPCRASYGLRASRNEKPAHYRPVLCVCGAVRGSVCVVCTWRKRRRRAGKTPGKDPRGSSAEYNKHGKHTGTHSDNSGDLSGDLCRGIKPNFLASVH